MEKNKRLNPRNILDKPIYNSILSLLNTYSDGKVKFNHLKYALVDKKYPQLKEKMEEFFRYSAPVEHIDVLTKEYEKGTINQKVYTAFILFMKENYLQRIQHKLGSESSLRDKLYELTNLKLIDKKADKKGYPYYIVTDLGKKLYFRWSTHETINNNIKDEEIEDFYYRMVAYVFKKEKVSFR